ncbi:MAG: hypothetical protein KDH19_04185 [Geminicoccaceae bacterium]|nr:hypothetical protein [Geminicoccaceae bacterium]
MIGSNHRNDPPDDDITVIKHHESASGFAPLTLDPDRYAGHFDGLEIGEEDQKALLEALWSIMVAFVDLGFDVKNTDKCLPEIFNKDAISDGGVVDYENSNKRSRE